MYRSGKRVAFEMVPETCIHVEYAFADALDAVEAYPDRLSEALNAAEAKVKEQTCALREALIDKCTEVNDLSARVKEVIARLSKLNQDLKRALRHCDKTADDLAELVDVYDCAEEVSELIDEVESDF